MAIDETANERGASRKELVIGGIIVVVLLSLGVMKVALKPASSSEATAKPLSDTHVVEPDRFSTIQKVGDNRVADRREKALKAIADHQEAIAMNWRSKETPDRQMAIGNLYQYQLTDYYSAIDSYRALVDEFPKHDKTPQAYVEIAACFERLGDEVQARYAYREMVEKLDPALEHTKYARIKLGER